MIPISAAGREHRALETRPFVFDSTAVEKLENAVSAYHGCHFTIAFNTPESALCAALFAAGISPQDEVIAGAMAPLHHYTAATSRQAALRLCDIGLDGNLYAKALQDLVTERTKAVLSGRFEGIRAVPPVLPASAALIEDASASPAPVEVAANTVWSMQTVMPEGIEKTGFVLTNDEQAATRLKHFREQGRKNGTLWNYDLVLRGADTKLGLLAAAVALEQMETIASACDRRRANAERLDELFQGSTLFDRMKRPQASVPDRYSLLLTPPLYCPKEDIYNAVVEKGVEAAVCCKPLYRTTAYRDDTVRLPVTEDFYKALLQLPCHHRLSTAEVETVARALLESVETYGYRGCRF